MAEHHEPRDHEDARAVRDVRALFARAWLETVPAMRLLEAPGLTAFPRPASACASAACASAPCQPARGWG